METIRITILREHALSAIPGLREQGNIQYRDNLAFV